MNRLMAALLSQVWAMDAGALDRVVAVLARHAAGVVLDPSQIDAAIAEPKAAAAERHNTVAPGSVAVIPVWGVVAHRARMVQSVSGPSGTSSEIVMRQFRAALADPNVAAILLDVDSPGGSVMGTPELADAILHARGQKPIVAHANALMASAAYWIASAADEIVASPSALVGSIGVLAVHADTSVADAAAGVKYSIIHYGRHKAEGASVAPLSDEARATLQAQVDHYGSVMTASIAKGRGVGVDVVRGEQYGEGRAFVARDAMSRGMVDRIEPFDATLDRLQNARKRAHVGRNANALRLASA